MNHNNTEQAVIDLFKKHMISLSDTSNFGQIQSVDKNDIGNYTFHLSSIDINVQYRKYSIYKHYYQSGTKTLYNPYEPAYYEYKVGDLEFILQYNRVADLLQNKIFPLRDPNIIKYYKKPLDLPNNAEGPIIITRYHVPHMSNYSVTYRPQPPYWPNIKSFKFRFDPYMDIEHKPLLKGNGFIDTIRSHEDELLDIPYYNLSINNVYTMEFNLVNDNEIVLKWNNNGSLHNVEVYINGEHSISTDGILNRPSDDNDAGAFYQELIDSGLINRSILFANLL